MKLHEALERGRTKGQEGKSRRLARKLKSSAYPDKLVQLFNRHFKEEGFGNPPPVTKKVRNMLNGFIRVCRSNGWEEEEINSIPIEIVKNWEYIKKQEHHTMNGKRALLGDRPSLLEFIICRETVLNALEKSKYYNVEESVTEEKQAVEVIDDTPKFEPTDEELAAEYEKMMEDMF